MTRKKGNAFTPILVVLIAGVICFFVLPKVLNKKKSRPPSNNATLPVKASKNQEHQWVKQHREGTAKAKQIQEMLNNRYEKIESEQ